MARITAMTPRQPGARERAVLTLMLSAGAIVTAGFLFDSEGGVNVLHRPPLRFMPAVVFSAGIKH
jgi:hypothetical protein